MPHIPRELIESVVILLSESGKPIGTAFVMNYVDLTDITLNNFYLVTCEHCVLKRVKARFSDDSTLDIEPDSWRKPLSGDDVVVIDINCFVAGREKSIGFISGEIVGRENPAIWIGTDLYMLGLLVDEIDIGANVPRARFGNLSAFADDRVPTRQGNGANRPCHLGDMRSRTGFSGSPVIGYLGIPALGGMNYRHVLLGVHSDQHHERIRVYSESSERAVEIPSSMTRIVPAWIIAELIEKDEELASYRNRRKGESESV